MTVSLRIATPADTDRAAAMAAAFHAEQGRKVSESARARAIATLLDGIPQAIFYFIGPPKSPVGYVLISFGFALDLGGLTATVRELYIRPAVRGRGMGGDAVAALGKALSGHGVVALHIDPPLENPRATVFCRRLGFLAGPAGPTMTRRI